MRTALILLAYMIFLPTLSHGATLIYKGKPFETVFNYGWDDADVIHSLAILDPWGEHGELEHYIAQKNLYIGSQAPLDTSQYISLTLWLDSNLPRNWSGTIYGEGGMVHWIHDGLTGEGLDIAGTYSIHGTFDTAMAFNFVDEVDLNLTTDARGNIVSWEVYNTAQSYDYSIFYASSQGGDRAEFSFIYAEINSVGIGAYAKGSTSLSGEWTVIAELPHAPLPASWIVLASALGAVGLLGRRR
ncbi:hypothetical protein [Rhodovulum steppense]|uniref:Uncharacterized protein n=1 Tax=Rhodovulum steppense TaxID=540251 RepID=A0A4R1YNG4_9RHOB|nr:hypothetical protein [Rhodovulum steppense]TCM79634.1 hypothetical protein EV216_12223 [Rhodovulum steppense]